MDTVQARPDDHPRTRAWLRGYLSHDHDNLGRTGSVCPFVSPALKADMIVVETAVDDAGSDLSELCRLMRQQIDRFDTVAWPPGKEALAALVTVLPSLPPHHGVLLDEAQRRTKAYAVQNGRMIGQFHPNCAEPAIWNPTFHVSRSPEPLFAIRRMAFHDLVFLHADPLMFAEYRKRFGKHYECRNSQVSEEFARLYELASRRGDGRSDYIDYQCIDVLLSLQHPHTDHPAEMTFYLSGQIKELLFKLVHEQTRMIRTELAADRVDEAVWGLRRIATAVELMSHTWNLLGTLAPTEFNSFRDQLGGASGIDSYMYRMMEFALGRKSDELAARYASVPGVAIDVYRTLHESSVYDEALFLLVRRGLLTERATGTEAHDVEAVSEAWAGIYRTTGPSGDLFRLAEALMNVAEGFSRWQALHLLVVERMIGTKPGTGGTEGVDWLRRSADHRLFPELWRARTLLRSGSCPF
jgi:tryptophan 2,3-dioxygenase